MHLIYLVITVNLIENCLTGGEFVMFSSMMYPRCLGEDQIRCGYSISGEYINELTNSLHEFVGSLGPVITEASHSTTMAQWTCSFKLVLQVSSDVFPEEGLLGHKAVSFLTCWENIYNFINQCHSKKFNNFLKEDKKRKCKFVHRSIREHTMLKKSHRVGSSFSLKKWIVSSKTL